MFDNLKDDFVDGWIAEGLAQGRTQGLTQGLTQGKAQMLLRAMTARGLTVTEDIRLRVAECADPAQLELWFDRAMTATTTDEVFVGPGRRWPGESAGEAEDAGGVVSEQGFGGEA